MSNTSATIAIALVISLAAPATSFARKAGEAGAGNLPISGIPPGPANVGGVNNVLADPSGIGNAAKVPAPPAPHITRTGDSDLQVTPMVSRFRAAKPASTASVIQLIRRI